MRILLSAAVLSLMLVAVPRSQSANQARSSDFLERAFVANLRSRLHTGSRFGLYHAAIGGSALLGGARILTTRYQKAPLIRHLYSRRCGRRYPLQLCPCDDRSA